MTSLTHWSASRSSAMAQGLTTTSARWTWAAGHWAASAATTSMVLRGPEDISRSSCPMAPSLPPTKFLPTRLYETCLNRAGSTAEISGWVSAVAAVGRVAVVAAIVHATEFRTDQVTAFFITFLHRTGSPSEVAGAVNSGADLLTIQVVFASSSQFFING